MTRREDVINGLKWIVEYNDAHDDPLVFSTDILRSYLDIHFNTALLFEYYIKVLMGSGQFYGKNSEEIIDYCLEYVLGGFTDKSEVDAYLRNTDTFFMFFDVFGNHIYRDTLLECMYMKWEK